MLPSHIFLNFNGGAALTEGGETGVPTLSTRAVTAALEVLIALSSFLLLCLNRTKLEEVLALADKLIASVSAEERAQSFALNHLAGVVALRRTFARIEAGDAR